MNEKGLPPLYEQIYRLVAMLPTGKVSTYGDIASALGTCDARTVGYALNALPSERSHDVPWQRIVNSKGGISTPGPDQRAILEEEGIVFDERGYIPLHRYRWQGPEGDDATAEEQLSLF